MENQRKNKMLSGVIPDIEIYRLIENEMIVGASIANVQPATLDLQLDLNTIFELSHLTFPRRTESVDDLIQMLKVNGVAKEHKPLVISPGKHYWIKLKEKIRNIPCNGRVNAKSSVGRIFNQCRLFCNKQGSIDEFPTHYDGDFWVTLSPKFFPILLSEKESLNQLRFFSGDARLTADSLQRLLVKNPSLVHYPKDLFVESIEVNGHSIGEVALTADLKHACYRTKKTDVPLDMARRDNDFHLYYELIDPDSLKEGLLLEQDRGYLIGSRERFSVPGDIAVEVVNSDRFGDFKAHFAGFIDCGFGLESANSITLEIVSHEPGRLIRDGQEIASTRFEYMSTIPENLYKGNYVEQTKGAKLPKYVR